MGSEGLVRRLEEIVRSLEALQGRVEAQVNGAEPTPSGVRPLPPLILRDCHAVTIRLPKDQWTLLRAAAGARARLNGGRVSLSQVIAEAVEAYRATLEADIDWHDG